ncbi:MAG: 3'-5' exonuclease, partial [Erysipelotrichaceae bacterium]|nr:3'-5' exonuclease [Erysipelotrichaceae bacterium]
GISDEMVKDARVDTEVLKDFLAFAEGLPLVGFNSEHFDLPFLMEAGRKIGVKIDNQSIDVMKIAAKTLYNGKYPKLSKMCMDMGIINNQAHRALSDAIATAEVYLGMANRQKG